MFQEWEQQRDCFLWTAPLFLLIILHQIFYTEYLAISHLYRKYNKSYKNSKSFTIVQLAGHFLQKRFSISSLSRQDKVQCVLLSGAPMLLITLDNKEVSYYW